MLADLFTKLLQGKVFHVFWRVIMGYETISWLQQRFMTTMESFEKANKLFNCNKYVKSEQYPKRVKANTYNDIVVRGNRIQKSTIINSRNENLVLTNINYA